MASVDVSVTSSESGCDKVTTVCVEQLCESVTVSIYEAAHKLNRSGDEFPFDHTKL